MTAVRKQTCLVLVAVIFAIGFFIGAGRLVPHTGLASNNYWGYVTDASAPTFPVSDTAKAAQNTGPPAPWPCCGCHWAQTRYGSGSSQTFATRPPDGGGTTGRMFADITQYQDYDSHGNDCYDTYQRASMWEVINAPGTVKQPTTMYVEIRMFRNFTIGESCSGQVGEWYVNWDEPAGFTSVIYTNLVQTGYCTIGGDTYNTNARSNSTPQSWNPSGGYYPYANV